MGATGKCGDGVYYIFSMPKVRIDMAREFYQEAYRLQMQGELELAERMYKRSIEMHPTAEAHTYLGWTYHFQGKLDEAIDECKKAIAHLRSIVINTEFRAVEGGREQLPLSSDQTCCCRNRGSVARASESPPR